MRVYRYFCLELREYAWVWPLGGYASPQHQSDEQQQRRFRLEIMEAIQSEVKKLIDSDFIREEQTLIGWLISSPSPRRMGRSGFAL